MKYFFIITLMAAFNFPAVGQMHRADSLKQLLKKAAPDSNRVKLLLQTADFYYFSKPDSCLLYSLKARKLAKDLQLPYMEISSLQSAGESLRFLGDYPGALKMQLDALKLCRKIKDRKDEAGSLGYIGFTYVEFGEYRLALQNLFASLAINKETHNQLKYTFDLTNIGNAYDQLNMPDSALYYQLKAIESYAGLKHGQLKSLTLTRLGNAYAHAGQEDSAMVVYNRALANCFLINDKINISKVQSRMANLFSSQKKYESGVQYAHLAYINGTISTQRGAVMEASSLLSQLYRKLNNPDSALFYQDIAVAMKDSLYSPAKFKQLQMLLLEEQEHQRAIEQEQERYRNKINYTILLLVLGVFLLFSFLLLRSNRHKQKAKVKIQKAYTELQATQQQLVQSAKMASLGELTAGIAHEIQNPLNFVNNFSEVNTELIEELKSEKSKAQSERDEQLETELLNDIAENEKKINHHGKRADAIVKGMLQHSQNSAGVKESTNINALTGEYLRLAYHGLRAKDKSFNTTMKTDFDENIGNINIIPQDIGRVILNLINNAFYAVDEKRKSGIENYEPIVSLSTKRVVDKVLISVKDNGNGIPKKVLDKIFQPFFTTKPTGQGTGLGLSLSYDIVKAHGGELKVKTKEGEFAEFIIQLPG
jgi:two-component system, NtrC family, sensor kinase